MPSKSTRYGDGLTPPPELDLNDIPPLQKPQNILPPSQIRAARLRVFWVVFAALACLATTIAYVLLIAGGG